MGEENSSKPLVSVVIPAKNEAERIKNVIETVKKSKLVDEIVVVDGFSKDDTWKISESCGAKVVMQSKRATNGKGIAMETGLKAAKGDIILFMDADLENVSPEWADKLVEPIIKGKANVVKAAYDRPGFDAPVTKLVAIPMLRIFFPEIKIKAPLEGEIAARRHVFEKVKFDGNWGVDVGLVIDVALDGGGLHNVHLGIKKHKSSFKNDVAELHTMSEQILKTILRKAYEYGRLTN